MLPLDQAMTQFMFVIEGTPLNIPATFQLDYLVDKDLDEEVRRAPAPEQITGFMFQALPLDDKSDPDYLPFKEISVRIPQGEFLNDVLFQTSIAIFVRTVHSVLEGLAEEEPSNVIQLLH